MSFADLAALGSFISAIGVLASLIYLGLQIRQNTRAVRSQINQGITENWLNLGALVTTNARAFAVGISADEKAFAAMSDEDKFVFLTTIFGFFKHFENMYLQCQEGFIPRETWEAWQHQMFMYWNMRGVQTWWKSRRLTFSPEFRRFIEESPKSAMPLTTDFFGQVGGERARPGVV